MTYRPHLGFWDKLLIYAACALAGAIFFTVGWIAVEPADPMGPVSLLTGRVLHLSGGALHLTIALPLISGCCFTRYSNVPTVVKRWDH